MGTDTLQGRGLHFSSLGRYSPGMGNNTFLGWGLTFSRYNSRMGSDNLQEWGLTLFSGRVVGGETNTSRVGIDTLKGSGLYRDRD